MTEQTPVKRDAHGNRILAEVNGFTITAGEFCLDVRGHGKHLMTHSPNLEAAKELARQSA
jgi:hypothetical protein